MSAGYTWPSRSNLHFWFLTFGKSGAALNALKCNRLTPLCFTGLAARVPDRQNKLLYQLTVLLHFASCRTQQFNWECIELNMCGGSEFFRKFLQLQNTDFRKILHAARARGPHQHMSKLWLSASQILRGEGVKKTLYHCLCENVSQWSQIHCASTERHRPF